MALVRMNEGGGGIRLIGGDHVEREYILIHTRIEQTDVAVSLHGSKPKTSSRNQHKSMKNPPTPCQLVYRKPARCWSAENNHILVNSRYCLIIHDNPSRRPWIGSCDSIPFPCLVLGRYNSICFADILSQLSSRLLSPLSSCFANVSWHNPCDSLAPALSFSSVSVGCSACVGSQTDEDRISGTTAHMIIHITTQLQWTITTGVLL